MTIRVLVQPAAEADIVEAALWYESRASGLGSEFLRSVEVGIEVSGSFPPVAGSCPRRCRRAGWRPPSTAGPTTGWARPTTPSRRGPVGEGHTLTRVRWEVYGDWSDDPTKLQTEIAWLLA